MDFEEPNQSVDPSTQVSSPDDQAATEAAPAPNMSEGQGTVDPQYAAKQNKIEEICGAVTDPKNAPENQDGLLGLVGKGLVKGMDYARGKLPPWLQSIAPRAGDSPISTGYGPEAKQQCIDRANASPGERLKMDAELIKKRYDEAKQKN